MRRLHGQEGAAAVEFGLLVPLLVMLAFGIIEFSTAYNRSQGMQAGVREAARYAATADVSTPDVKQRLIIALQSNDGGSGFDPATADADIDVDVDYADAIGFGVGLWIAPGGCNSAHAVRVRASIVPDRQDDYGVTLPLIPGAAPAALDHRAEAIFRCLG